MSVGYWQKRMNRRRMLVGSGALTAGAVGLFLTGCGGENKKASSPVSTRAAGGPSPAVGAPSRAAGGPSPAAGAASPAAARPVAGGTYKVLGGPVGGLLDPHRSNTPYEVTMWHWVGNFVVRLAVKDGLPEPDLVSAMPEIPGDGTQMLFKLNPDAKWQNKAPTNGRPVTAEDVKLSIERIKNPETTSLRVSNYANVDSITAIDQQSFSLKLKVPQADLLNLMGDTYDIVLPKEISARGKDAVRTPEDVVGSGPYELTAYEAGKGLTVQRRGGGFWKPNTAWLDGYTVVNQVDNQAIANAMLAGETSQATLPLDLIKQFDKNPKYQIGQAIATTRQVLSINETKPPYNNPLVRQALWRGIDRKQIYDKVYGAGKPGGVMTPSATFWALPDAELAKLPGFGPRDQELAEAKKLLAAAGMADGFSDKIMTATAFQADQVADVIISSLAPLGIKLTADNIGTDFTVMVVREGKGDFSLAGTLRQSGPYPDAQLLPFHHTSPQIGNRNYGKTGSPALDAKLEKQSQIYDTKQRQALVYEIQRDIINNPGPAWLGSNIAFTVAVANLQNYVATGFAAGYQGAENFWFKPA
jgi:peptide/nickel transport system substrate-binding protein